MIHISNDEIKNRPYQIAQMLINNRNDPDFLKATLCYGPNLCRELDPEESYSMARKGNDFDVFDAMLINRYVDACYTDSMNPKCGMGPRTKLGKILKELSYDTKNMPFEKANCMMNLYKIIDYSSKTGSGNESVMTGTSPIVPYGQVVRNPDVVSAAKEEMIASLNGGDRVSKYMHMNHEDEEMMLKQYASRNSGSMHDHKPYESYDEFIKGLKEQDDESMSYYGGSVYNPYYLVAYKHFSKDPNKIEDFVNGLESLSLFDKEPEDFFALMESLTYGEKINVDSAMKHAKIMDDHMIDMFEKLGTPDETLHNYPIDKLRNYLNTTHRYMASKYLSSLFLSQNKTIDHYIMEIEKIPIAEVKDKYLVAPVIDYAAGFKPTLISLDRDGNIKVFDSILDLSPLG